MDEHSRAIARKVQERQQIASDTISACAIHSAYGHDDWKVAYQLAHAAGWQPQEILQIAMLGFHPHTMSALITLRNTM